MAIKAMVETDSGEQRELYIRVNNVEASNHGAVSHALFRGFVSKAAFDARKAFVWERLVEFTPDVSQPIWPQAYAALRAALAHEDDPLKAQLAAGAVIADA